MPNSFSIPSRKESLTLIASAAAEIAWDSKQKSTASISRVLDSDCHYFIVMSVPTPPNYFTTTKSSSGQLMDSLPDFVQLPDPAWTNTYMAYEGDAKAGETISASITSETTQSRSSFWILAFAKKN